MKSKTFIKKQTSKKTNSELVETIKNARNNKKWMNVAGLISSPRKNHLSINLSKLDRDSKEGESVLIIGKILSEGDITKKIKVIALGFSKGAKEKLLNAKCDVVTINEEIKSNPEFKGVRILK